MQRTSIGALVALFAFLTAAMAMVTWRFYGSFPPLPAAGAATIWVLALVCVVCIFIVRRNLAEGWIGLDRSQLDPITVARMMVVGKASAWTGTILGGLYAGIGVYVVPRVNELIAAEAETPIVLTGLLGSIVLAGAGVVLERNCETPPPPDTEAIS